MSPESPFSGWVVTGYQAVVFVWAWSLLVVIHGLWRSMWSPATDPIRASGPIE